MRFSPLATIVALLAALAFAPAASAANLLADDADPTVTFDDTDVGPADWSIEANTTSANTLTFFTTASANPILSLSPQNVGIGELNPAFDLHINTNDTPGVRLQQNNTGGFTAQTWDIAANEANFFVRDVTNGSLLPFRVRPGAPTSSIDISAAGNVGVGTASPAAALDVSRAAPPSLFLTNRATDGVDWEVAAGSNLVLKTQTGSAALTVAPTGDATATGALQQNADVNALENRANADPAAVLAAVGQLPVGYFEYTADPSNARHLGPLAPDFRALGLGASDNVIAPADLGGVALVAIKGLAANDANVDKTLASFDDRLKTTDARVSAIPDLKSVNGQLADLATGGIVAKQQITALEKRNSALSKRLRALEKTVKALSRKR